MLSAMPAGHVWTETASATKGGWARRVSRTHAPDTALDTECVSLGPACAIKAGLEHPAMCKPVQTNAADTAHALVASAIAKLAGRATTVPSTCVETLCVLDTAHAIKECAHATNSGKETDATPMCAQLPASRAQVEVSAVTASAHVLVLGEDRSARSHTVDPRVATTTARVTLCLLCASATPAMLVLTAATVLRQVTQAHHLDQTNPRKMADISSFPTHTRTLSLSLPLFSVHLTRFVLRHVPYQPTIHTQEKNKTNQKPQSNETPKQ